MWTITDDRNNATSIAALSAQYPDLVAYDESGYDVDLDDLAEHSESLADAGYGPRESRRILLWADEDRSQDDDGARAVASAVWTD